MRIVLNNDIPVRDWNDFFHDNAFATPFQSYDFYSLVNSSPALSAEAAAVYDGGKIHAMAVITLQRSSGLYGFFSRRAIIYGGPLAEVECPEALDLLIGHITAALKGRVIYSETRNLSDYSCFKQIFKKNGWEYVPYLNFHLQTADHDTMTRAISDSRLRQIKKARSAGVSWRKAESVDDVRAFYLILADLYRKKIRKPLMPWDFFRLFFEKQSGVFLLVIYKDKVIGGIMCPLLENKAIYEFYICGLDEEYNEQHPSIMATWAAMEYAAENKIPVLDFMGAGKPGEGYGVRDFKADFGGEIVRVREVSEKDEPVIIQGRNTGHTIPASKGEMRIIIDIGHPAHVHLFRFFTVGMIAKGHDVLFTYRKKEYEEYLLEKLGFTAVSLGKHYSSTAGKFFSLITSVIRMYFVARKFRPDLFLSHGSLIAAQASWLYRRPHISLEDTGNREQVRFYLPFTSVVLTSESFQDNYGLKQVRYNSFHELAYLRPNYFTVDQCFKKSLGLAEGEKLIIVRFISWSASHEKGITGLSAAEKTDLVTGLSKYGKVFISSESPLPENLSAFLYPLAPETIHQAMAIADLFIGEGATMASESCMLGTPAIYINSQRAGTINAQAGYGLIFQFFNYTGVTEKAVEILLDPDSRVKFHRKRERLLAEKIDLTRLLIWFAESWPESFTVVKSDPDFQKKFI